MEKEPVKSETIPYENHDHDNLYVLGNPEVVSTERREIILQQTKSVIRAVDEKLGQKGNWTIEFFPPKSEEEIISDYRLNFERNYDQMYTNDIRELLKENNLRLGGFRATNEDEDASYRFLALHFFEKTATPSKKYGCALLKLNGVYQIDLDGETIRHKYSTSNETPDSIATHFYTLEQKKKGI